MSMEKSAPDRSGLIVNVDDLGMCHGANVAYLDLFARGRCDSGSVMVPCPWFSEIAEAGQQDPALKLGVHFTLTAEKKHYRWRPLTSPSPRSGLVDGDGYLHANPIELRRRADPGAVEEEMRAQVEVFLGKGLKPTHFDPHQDAALAPEFLPIYVKLGRDYDVPVLFPKTLAGHDSIGGIGDINAGFYGEMARELALAGHFLVDQVLETPWHLKKTAEERYRQMFVKAEGAGLTFVALHANVPGDIEGIEPDTAMIRTGEYEVLRDPERIAWLDDLDVVRGTLRAFQHAPRHH
jgi:predicted glycoside hydrolase/deacetylase ChbG (UPF0249 family)